MTRSPRSRGRRATCDQYCTLMSHARRKFRSQIGAIAPTIGASFRKRVANLS
jgi:hypothetical protein